mmetsp:Transcript_48939/g.72753  ORF Transcript_48939/g.72753 Transcript_48939/m.72753 type:complete len:119 (-) Transcript_48939:67-423(-)|eukprot:CAMPEP_0195526252 /NCGR_PEP_ID=MMETSP0794_2-20130614/27195_1 /TAXON_ID=515487 /ORGANISM="Stephanopyxis turris, Strain CCMP 815" /LENGTH=118 /DNA_ID=CAMNT_0040656889 /DNA_START=65 /DNA_END=421 /DNA_ORIENTATION=-
MVREIRVQYRRRHCYRTKSNKVKVTKTPGGRLVAHYHAKKAGSAVCGEPHCRAKLAGIKAARPKAARRLKGRERTVSRAYGGVLCMNCTRQKVIRAFLIEEQQIVKKVVAEAARRKRK